MLQSVLKVVAESICDSNDGEDKYRLNHRGIEAKLRFRVV